jgi:hypothetical protein
MTAGSNRIHGFQPIGSHIVTRPPGLSQRAYKRIEQWHNEPIEGEFPNVSLDGLWLKRS